MAANHTGKRPKPIPECDVWNHEITFDAYEPRLVLSAQGLNDLLHAMHPDPGDMDLHRLEWTCQPIQPSIHTVSPFELVPAGSLSQAHEQTGLHEAWRLYGLRGQGQTVAVIDSGIAWDHVALGGGFGPGYRVVGGWDFTEENDPNPYDDPPAGFHGTHIAGILAANDGQQFGVAPEVDLVALRVFNDRGVSQIEWVEQALQWIVDNKNSFANPITTVNISVGGAWNSSDVPDFARFEDELKQLHDSNIIVVSSAGNGFQQYQSPGLSYPAVSPYVIPVASVDDSGLLSSFSQRHERAIAAPGQSILSTVPDHVLGKDGIVNDWSSASGTSMASPYVAGATVLVRQAMELAGVSPITVDSIYQHLMQTSDSIWDAVTQASYQRLNLGRAIEALLPPDTVGDNLQSSMLLGTHDQTFDGWINSLKDRDFYRFQPEEHGTLQVSAASDSLNDLRWEVWENGVKVSATQGYDASIELQAGRTYHLGIADGSSIGPYRLNIDWQNATEGSATSNLPEQLGTLAYHQQTVVAGQALAFQSERDGWLTIQVQSSIENGEVKLTNSDGQSYRDATWKQGLLRLDQFVRAGDRLQVELPASPDWLGQLTIANLIQQTDQSLRIFGTETSDSVTIGLSDVRTEFTIGNIQYAFDRVFQEISIDGRSGNDHLVVMGTPHGESLQLRPEEAFIENRFTRLNALGFEFVRFEGGGGTDRATIYDGPANDTLTAKPGYAELVGVGYRFELVDVSRSYFLAEAGGQNIAFLKDGVGDDALAVWPKFASLRGDDFFYYATGFQRVNVYATAGGYDSAKLYDSPEADQFFTSGSTATFTGSNFFSSTKGFERVEAYSTAGGNDVVRVFAEDSSEVSQIDARNLNFAQGNWIRTTQGFANHEIIVQAANSFNLQQFAVDPTESTQPTLLREVNSESIGNDDRSLTSAFAQVAATEINSHQRTPSPFEVRAAAMELLPADEAILSDEDEHFLIHPQDERRIISKLLSRW